MEPAQNALEQSLRAQLNEANRRFQRSSGLNHELKTENERLTLENYALIRQLAVLKHKYENIRSGAANVTKFASNLENIVTSILPDFQAAQAQPPEQVQPKSVGYVQMTPKAMLSSLPTMTALQSTPKPVSAVPANVKQPTTKQVQFASNQKPQINCVNGKSIDSVVDAAPKNGLEVVKPGVVAKKTLPTVENAPKKAAPVAEVTPQKMCVIEKVATKKVTPQKMPSIILERVQPVEKNMVKPALQPKLAEAKKDSSENLVKDVPKMVMPNPFLPILLDRANVNKLKANSSVTVGAKAVDAKLVATPKSKKTKRKAEYDVSDDNTKQSRLTRSKSKSDKDESATHGPIPQQTPGDGKKKAESQHKVVTSTPRPSSSVLLSKKVVDGIDGRSQTITMKSVSIKLESVDSARTSVYKSDSKKIAKRRQTMLM
ncbi:uncharacterized protein LOC129568181 [Sitodiplosis mosellana]|uniref:uncharacterized protein LOC129568181 n=1 Tax=Sitodiplosis mosellana TaxID=263140 RepID=UPI0024452199|nr:uncharacterized protein LOC129568181 [Sitodiplosis mosellana]